MTFIRQLSGDVMSAVGYLNLDNICAADTFGSYPSISEHGLDEADECRGR